MVPGGWSPGMIFPAAVITATRSPSGRSGQWPFARHIALEDDSLIEALFIAGTYQLHEIIVALTASEQLVDQARLQCSLRGVAALRLQTLGKLFT